MFTSGNRAPTPGSPEDLENRLIMLQSLLHPIVEKAIDLLNDVHPQAPYPIHMSDGFPVWKVHYLGIDQGETLIVKMPENRNVVVERNPRHFIPEYPLHRLRLRRPEAPGVSRLIEVAEHPTSELEYHPEVTLWEDIAVNSKYLGRVALSMADEDIYMQELDTALDDAREVAEEHGLVVPYV